MLNLNDFMNKGIKNIIDTAGRFYTDSRRGAFFYDSYGIYAAVRRLRQGDMNRRVYIFHPFLLQVLRPTVTCTVPAAMREPMADVPVKRCQGEMHLRLAAYFGEASELGVSFIFFYWQA